MNGFMRGSLSTLAIALASLVAQEAHGMGRAPSKPDPRIDARSLRERLGDRVAGAHQGGLFQDHAVNTLGVFEEAYGEGASLVEMDLRATRDGQLVAFHDAELQYLSNCRGKVSEYTLEEISQCSLMTEERRPAPKPEDAIPSFRAILDWSKGKALINAEFKELESIAPAIALVREKNAYEWVYFQAKNDPKRYELARALDPKVNLLFAADTVEQLDWALSLNDPHLVVIEIDKTLRKPEHIDAIHRAGKFVSENAWHFRADREIRDAGCDQVYAAGIDIAISNRPADCAAQWRKLTGRAR